MITVLRQLTFVKLILKFIPCPWFIIQFLYQVQLIFFSFVSELCCVSVCSQFVFSLFSVCSKLCLSFVSGAT